MSEALRVVALGADRHEVQTQGGQVLAVCTSSAGAWKWIDRHQTEREADTDRHYRIRQSGRFS